MKRIIAIIAIIVAAIAITPRVAHGSTSECRLTVQPWDEVSRQLAYRTAGSDRVNRLITEQGTGAALLPTTFIVPGDVSEVLWVKAADGWQVVMHVVGCMFVDIYPGVPGKRASLVIGPTVPSTTVPSTTVPRTTVPRTLPPTGRNLLAIVALGGLLSTVGLAVRQSVDEG